MANANSTAALAPLFPAPMNTSTLRDVTRQRKQSASASAKLGAEVSRDNALRRLIRTRMADLDLTYTQVAERGGWKTHSSVYALANKSHHAQPPRPETLRRLAKALSVPLDVVRVAAAQSAGYKFEEIPTTLEASEDLRIIAVGLNELSAEQRDQIRKMVADMVEQTRVDQQGDEINLDDADEG